jgi:hypothetical protein
MACVVDGALKAGEACQSAPTSSPTVNPLPVLGISGGAVLGVATITGIVAGYFAIQSTTSYGQYAKSQDPDAIAGIRGNESIAIGTGAVAGALALTGVGLVAAELILEDAP